MTVAAVMTITTQGGAGPNGLGVEGITAAVGWITALILAGVGLSQARTASKANVSGDAQKAREQEEIARNNTLSHWQKLVAQYDREIERKDREHAEEVAELRAELNKQNTACDAMRVQIRQQETVLLVHVPWDFQAVNVAAEAGKPLPPPPPLRPPPEGS